MNFTMQSINISNKIKINECSLCTLKKQMSAMQEYKYSEKNSKEIWNIHFILLLPVKKWSVSWEIKQMWKYLTQSVQKFKKKWTWKYRKGRQLLKYFDGNNFVNYLIFLLFVLSLSRREI